MLSARRKSLLRRRLTLDDPTSLAVRVARARARPRSSRACRRPTPATASSTSCCTPRRCWRCRWCTADASRGCSCASTRAVRAAYAQRELAKAELLASQVAVALDNAYQHALQRRRLEELSALYEFAQSAHTALSSVEIVRQLLPILKERLNYTYGTIWLRDETTGALRLAAGDGPGRHRCARLASVAAGHAGVRSPGACAGRPGLGRRPSRAAGARTRSWPCRWCSSAASIGVVDLESARRIAWSPPEERLLVALANHAALAVDNLHLLDETRKVAALKELDRMKTELLSTVSHELRTPLGLDQGLRHDAADARQQAEARRAARVPGDHRLRGRPSARADRESARHVTARGWRAADRQRAGSPRGDCSRSDAQGPACRAEPHA